MGRGAQCRSPWLDTGDRSQSCDHLGEKEKQAQRTWSRIPGKPRKTRHCVLNDNKIILFHSCCHIFQLVKINTYINTKNYIQSYVVIIPSLQWGKGLVVVLWFFNWVLFIVSILSQKKVEGHFWFLGNLQNHKTHLQKYVSMTYNITSLENYNHTILNFGSLGYSWHCCILSAKNVKGHTHLFLA